MEYNMSDSSQGSESAELNLQGSIENFSLPEILQLVATTRKAGTLAIQNQNAIVMVYFKDGNIIYAYGPQQTYHIGQLLKELEVLTPAQLEQAVRIQTESETSARLGEILIAQKFITRSELETVVKTQIEELLYSLLSWRTGSFKFYENQLPTEEEIIVRLSVENVILEGLRRFDEMNMAQSALPDIDAVYTIAVSEADRQKEVAMAASESGGPGIDYLVSLFAGDQDVTFVQDNTQVVEAVARGTQPIGMFALQSQIENFKEEGFNLEVVRPTDWPGYLTSRQKRNVSSFCSSPARRPRWISSTTSRPSTSSTTRSYRNPCGVASASPR